jgi:L-ascorbate metabolism protein UlaG (beta-lactamase superfamily)
MPLDRDTAITWYGHSCFEVRTPGGVVILFDPWFGNPKSPKSANAVERCDILLVTHGHNDHFGDAQTIGSRLRPFWPGIHELSLWMSRRLPGGADAMVGMNKGGTVEHRGISITMVRADHSAGVW